MSETAAKLQSDMIVAMKGKDQLKLSVIRLAKTAIKNKEIEKRAPLTEDEVQAVLATMVKQRKDSIQQFTDGGRDDLALKEAGELDILALYMPREVGPDALKVLVDNAIAEVRAPGTALTKKDMGLVMKKAQELLKINGFRADGKLLSEIVKEILI